MRLCTWWSVVLGLHLSLLGIPTASQVRDAPLAVPGLGRPAHSRVLGGEAVEEGELPFVVSLRSSESSSPDQHICGAVALTPLHVLTAARCTWGRNASTLYVVAGTTALALTGTEGHDYTRISVEEKVEHQDYDELHLRNNIAVLRLSQTYPDSLKSAVNFATLIAGDIPHGLNCTVAGWGLTVWDSVALPGTLQKVVVPFVGMSACERYYGAYGMVDKSVVCAGPEDGGKGICSMDYGGPLICSGVLTGIASGGIGCASPYYPGLYTSTDYFVRWIREAVTGETVQVVPSTLYPPEIFTDRPVITTSPITEMRSSEASIVTSAPVAPTTAPSRPTSAAPSWGACQLLLGLMAAFATARLTGH